KSPNTGTDKSNGDPHPDKPKLFIGSSSQARPLTEAIIEQLKGDDLPVDIVAWYEARAWGSLRSTLQQLIDTAADYSYAVMVGWPDDLICKDNREMWAVRGNVVFELGLFLSAIGRDKTFMVMPRDSGKPGSVFLPTDLNGQYVIHAYSLVPEENNLFSFKDVDVSELVGRIQKDLRESARPPH